MTRKRNFESEMTEWQGKVAGLRQQLGESRREKQLLVERRNEDLLPALLDRGAAEERLKQLTVELDATIRRENDLLSGIEFAENKLQALGEEERQAVLDAARAYFDKLVDRAKKQFSEVDATTAKLAEQCAELDRIAREMQDCASTLDLPGLPPMTRVSRALAGHLAWRLRSVAAFETPHRIYQKPLSELAEELFPETAAA